jgi:DNA-binding NarL/FixJ family response regulator
MATHLVVNNLLPSLQILLAHPHRLVRDSMRPLLSKLSPRALLREITSFDALLEVGNGVQLLLLGDDLPGLDGVNGLQLLRQRWPDMRIMLMTDGSDPGAMLAAMAAGVAGVVLKSISSDALQSALRLVLSGELYLPAEMVAAMVRRTNRASHDDHPPVRFSPAETQVVPLLLDGLCNKIIARRLGIEEAAVKARLRGIYKKIGVVNRAQAVMRLLPSVRLSLWDSRERLPSAHAGVLALQSA